MDAGKLNRRIVIERFMATTNALNESVKTWAALATVSAQRKDYSLTEKVAAGELGASVAAHFVVRRSPTTDSITPADRLTHDGGVWNIKGKRELREDPLAFWEIDAAREV